MTKIIEARSLTKVFGKQRAVDNVSFHVNRGDVYGLIGRNGAGKTTIMRMLSGLATPTSGTYELLGVGGGELSGEGDTKKKLRISSLIENAGVYINMTAAENLRLKGLALGLKDDGYIARLLQFVGLGNVGNKKVKLFSQGMAQRLGIALTLVGDPDVIILDEPINGLDPQGIAEVREMIHTLNSEQGITFIISSHILEELVKVVNRFSIIDNGRIIKEMDCADLETQSSRYMQLEVPRAAELVPVLAELKISNYKVVSETIVQLFEGLGRTAEIAIFLGQKGIEIKTLTIHSNSLEDYYLSLTSAPASVAFAGGKQ